MDLTYFTEKFFTVAVDLLIPAIMTAAVYYISVFVKRLKNKTNSELLTKYLSMAEETVIKAVICTNQTFVDALKKNGTFGPEAQKEAFEMTKEAVLNILDVSVRDFLEIAIIDFDEWLKTTIEEMVASQKIV